MFKNYLTVAIRHLRRHKIYTLINVSGLAIGIAFCILTFLFVHNEWTHDSFHAKADRIFRVYRTDIQHDGSAGRPQPVRIPMGPLLKEAFPEVEHFVRFTGGREVSFSVGEKIFAGVDYDVDAEIFDVFDFPLKWGDEATALKDINSIVLSADMAQRFFGDENPIGKVLTQSKKVPEDFVVTGVLEPLPSNSSLQFDFLRSHKRDARMFTKWGGYAWNLYTNTQTYVLLHNADQKEDLIAKFPLAVEKVQLQAAKTHAATREFLLHLLPVTEMHLSTEVVLWGSSNPKYSYILSGIALLVLIIACINFINLSIGQSGTRAREVGVRKTVGASRGQVMKQFWSESILMSVFAVVFGVALAELLLPTFNALLNQKLSMLTFMQASSLTFLVGLVLFVGLAAGSVPTLVLSRFQPVAVIKGRLRVGGMNWFGRSLVVVQFALSILLVVSTVVMSGQLDYIREKNLGFNAEQVVMIDMWRLDDKGKQNALGNIIAQHSGVVSATTTQIFWPAHYRLSNIGTWEGGQTLKGQVFDVGYEFLDTFDIDVATGRDFSRERPADPTYGMIVNEALVQQMGWGDPIGKRFPFNFRRRRGSAGKMLETRNPEVIGVVKDFHISPLYHEIPPIVLLVKPGSSGLSCFRIHSEQTAEVLAFIKKEWKKLEPNAPLQYQFLDEQLMHQYQDDERWGNIIHYSALFAIFVACLGAFGLTALAVARRTKEIGIRKVLGATEASLMGLFSREFVWLVIVANVIAWPLAYYAMDQWLQDFAYRIDLGVGGFALGGVLTLGVVLATVNLQALRAVRANPVDALRDE